jgi:hypothetical protein
MTLLTKLISTEEIISPVYRRQSMAPWQRDPRVSKLQHLKDATIAYNIQHSKLLAVPFTPTRSPTPHPGRISQLPHTIVLQDYCYTMTPAVSWASTA